MAAAPGAAWAPRPEAIARIVEMLRNGTSGDKARMDHAMAELKELEGHPEMVNHLAYILVHCPAELLPIRDTAGASLTGIIGRMASRYELAALKPLKDLLLLGLASGDDAVRQLAANSASRLVRVLARVETNTAGTYQEAVKLPPHQRAWPELLPAMEAGFASGNRTTATGCALLASQLVEDNVSWVSAQGEGHLGNIVSRLYTAAAAEPAAFTGYAAAVVRPIMLLPEDEIPAAIKSRVEQWIDLLLAAASSFPDPSLRRKAWDGVVQMLEALPQHVASRVEAIVERGIAGAEDGDVTVAASALEVWSALVSWVEAYACATIVDGPGHPAGPAALRAAHDSVTLPLLPRIVPVLVRGLRIRPEDAEELPVDDDGGPAAAAAAASAARPAAGSGWVADSDEMSGTGMYTPRKASGWALESLARAAGGAVAEHVWPTVSACLSDTSPAKWQEVECGLKLLDCTLRGAYDWYKERLGAAIPLVLGLATTSTRPVVRTSACGVLHRCAGLIANLPDSAIAPTLGSIATCIDDGVGQVQARAVQALRATLEELQAADRLAPEWASGAALRVADRMPRLSHDARQQACTLFASLSERLPPHELAPMLSPVLTRILEWWATRPEGGTSDADYDTRVILETLNAVVDAAGPACATFAPTIVPRCMRLLANARISKEAAESVGERSYGVGAQDSAFEVLGNCVGRVLSESDAKAFLASGEFLSAVAWFTNHDDSPDVLESTLGALAECLDRYPAEIVPVLGSLWGNVVTTIHGDYGKACSQALWLAAEALRRVPTALGREHVTALAVRLRDVMTGKHDMSEGTSTQLNQLGMANAGIAVARLAALDPGMVHPWLGEAPALVNWLSCGTLTTDADEKLEVATAVGHAITAAPALVRSPEVARVMCAIVSSFMAVDHDAGQAASARTVCSALMSAVRAQMSDAEWAAETAACSKLIRRRVNDVTGMAVFPL